MFAPGWLIITLFAYLLILVIAALVLFAVIRAAVRAGLDDHYKTVRWYERTGEWAGRKAPRPFDS